MSGWIKLHREILHWQWYDDVSVKCVFIHLLLSANHAPSYWKGIAIGRGQKWTSVGKLSKECGLSEKQVRVAIDKLQKTGEIKSEGASNGTMLTVCKYDTYQSSDGTEGEQTGKRGANKGRTEGEQRATNNKNKNIKNDKEEQEVESVAAYIHPLITWITDNAPRVMSMKVPLTNETASKLMTDLKIETDASKERLKDILKAMHNRPNLLTNYLDANLTVRNWWKRDFDKSTQQSTEKLTITKGVYYK